MYRFFVQYFFCFKILTIEIFCYLCIICFILSFLKLISCNMCIITAPVYTFDSHLHCWSLNFMQIPIKKGILQIRFGTAKKVTTNGYFESLFNFTLNYQFKKRFSDVNFSKITLKKITNKKKNNPLSLLIFFFFFGHVKIVNLIIVFA